MELDQLRTFLAVLEQSSFSRAAETLKVGQSTVSFHIKALEAAAGARLIDRAGGGPLRPTSAGELLRKYARRMLSLREEALSRLHAEESAEAGRLTLAASTIPSEYLLPSLLAELFRRHPRLEVSIAVSDTRKAIAALVGQECELAFVGAQVRERRVIFTPFAHDEIVLVGRQRPGKPAPLALTGEARFIVREEGSGTQLAAAQRLARLAEREGEERPRPPPLRVGSTEAARQCALEGLGLALLSRRAVEEDLRAERLGLVEAPGFPLRRRFYVARLRGATLPASARALLSLAVQDSR